MLSVFLLVNVWLHVGLMLIAASVVVAFLACSSQVRANRSKKAADVDVRPATGGCSMRTRHRLNCNQRAASNDLVEEEGKRGGRPLHNGVTRPDLCVVQLCRWPKAEKNWPLNTKKTVAFKSLAKTLNGCKTGP